VRVDLVTLYCVFHVMGVKFSVRKRRGDIGTRGYACWIKVRKGSVCSWEFRYII
jgi:hypothetical protein